MQMVFRFKERYINLLTDFGFKRVFGTEAHKQLLSTQEIDKI